MIKKRGTRNRKAETLKFDFHEVLGLCLDILGVSVAGGFRHVCFQDCGGDLFRIPRSRHFHLLAFWPVVRTVSLVCMVAALRFFPSCGERGQKCVFRSCTESVLFIRQRVIFPKYCRVLSIKPFSFLDTD